MEQYLIGRDGSPALDFALGGRKRITKVTMRDWPGGCIALGDVFAEASDNQLDILFGAVTKCPDTRFVVSTARVGRMSEYLGGCRETHERNLQLGEKFPWPNVWFGMTLVDGEIDRVTGKRVMEFLRAPSAHRFLVAPASYELDAGLLVPKCKRCGGRGWYIVGNPFRTPHPDTTVCLECPVRELIGATDREQFLRDKRERGGELNWVVFTPTEAQPRPSESSIALCRKYGTAVTMTAEFDLATVPLWK